MVSRYGKIISLIIQIITYYTISTLYYSCLEIKNNNNDFLTEQEIQLLKDGDIILRCGNGILSNFITNSLDEKYLISHCGIICIDKSGINIIHTLSEKEGIQKCSLFNFCKESIPNSIIISRLKTDTTKNHLISKSAEQYLKNKIPFDNKFDYHDSTKLFCSELIRNIIMKHFDINLFEKNGKQRINFDNFYSEKYFKIIINHPEKSNTNNP